MNFPIGDDIGDVISSLGLLVLIGIGGLGVYAALVKPSPKDRELNNGVYKRIEQPNFRDVNGDGVEDEIRGETVRYGVNLPDGRRIYIPKEEFDGSGK